MNQQRTSRPTGTSASKSRRQTAARSTGPRISKKAFCYRHRKELLACVDQPLPKIETSTGYRLALVAVAFAMVLLPLCYLVTAVAAVIWLARHYFLHAWLISAGVVECVCYFVPALTGPFLTFFLFKPFFVSGGSAARPATLDPAEQSVLFDYVTTLCEHVGAPVPAQININNEVNATASLSHNNPFSSRVTLAIGIPLIYGLNLDQLSGVLAHELGHFAQRSGMRVSFVIRAVNIWFLRALASRDATHEWFERYLDRPGVLFWLAKAVFLIIVYSARCVLWVPWQLSNVISCLLIREMEFDADRVEAALVGAKTFRATHRRIVALSVAEKIAFDDINEFYVEGRLADDFPRLVAMSVDEMPPKLKRAIDDYHRQEQTTWFDTHPSQTDRFANVRPFKGDGVFTGSAKLRSESAAVLFDNVQRISRGLTRRLYKDSLGSRFRKEILYPANDLMERKKAELEADETLRRYFQVRMPVFYPIPLADDATKPCESAKATVDELMAAREQMIAAAGRYRRMLARFEAADNLLMDTAAAASLEGIGIASPPVLVLKRDRQMSAGKLNSVVQDAVSELAIEMLDYEHAAGQRISSAMRLLANPKAAAKFEQGDELKDRAAELVKHTFVARDMMSEVRNLRLVCHRIVVMFANLPGEMTYDVFDSLVTLLRTLEQSVKDLHWKMGSHEYPFDHGEGDKSLQEYAMPELPDERDVGGMIVASRVAFERLAVVQMRLFARLAVIAETIEKRIGLQPLQLPPDDDTMDVIDLDQPTGKPRRKRRS